MYGLSSGTEKVAVGRGSTLLAIRLMYDQGLFYGGTTKVEGSAKEKRDCLIYYVKSCLPPLGCLLVLFLLAPTEKGKKNHHWSPLVHAIPKAYN